jgi:TetR/AcrR family transcriptional regulator, mexJK operon transcriptional repressor
MPRAPGQIDAEKTEAILDAAAEVLGERGLAAPMEEVARRAGVSKQTIYNRYGSKAELVRALVERRMSLIVAPLGAPEAADNPQLALARFGRALLEHLITPNRFNLMRAYIQGAVEMPEVGRAVYEAGHEASRLRLAGFLAQESAAGRLHVGDPRQAADFFAGMVLGGYQAAALLGVDRSLSEAQATALAQEAAARFVRAYAP